MPSGLRGLLHLSSHSRRTGAGGVHAISVATRRSLLAKCTYRHARCLIPAEWWYEWQADDKIAARTASPADLLALSTAAGKARHEAIG